MNVLICFRLAVHQQELPSKHQACRVHKKIWELLKNVSKTELRPFWQCLSTYLLTFINFCDRLKMFMNPTPLVPSTRGRKCRPIVTVNILSVVTFSSLLLYVQYPEQPVCTSLLFTLLLLSPSTLFFSLFFCTSYCFFCTSCCFLHIFFAHLIVFCTSYVFLHILLFCTFFYFIAHFTLISPFLTICMPLCYVTLYNLYSYYFALSTERTWFDYISLLIIPCITIMWQIKKPWTLNLEEGRKSMSEVLFKHFFHRRTIPNTF